MLIFFSGGAVGKSSKLNSCLGAAGEQVFEASLGVMVDSAMGWAVGAGPVGKRFDAELPPRHYPPPSIACGASRMCTARLGCAGGALRPTDLAVCADGPFGCAPPRPRAGAVVVHAGRRRPATGTTTGDARPARAPRSWRRARSRSRSPLVRARTRGASARARARALRGSCSAPKSRAARTSLGRPWRPRRRRPRPRRRRRG